MSGTKLDRSKAYATIYGDSRAVYYQGGKHFDSNDDEISQEEAAEPSPTGETQQEIARLTQKLKTPTDAQEDLVVKYSTRKKGEPMPAEPKVEAPKVEKPKPAPAKVEVVGAVPEEQIPMAARLDALTVPVLKAMVAEAGGEPYKTKAENIAWLMDNVEE